MPSRIRVGSSSRGAARGRASAPQVYPGTMSGYGSTRADSAGESVPMYAYSAAQQDKAFNKKQQVSVPKVSEFQSRANITSE